MREPSGFDPDVLEALRAEREVEVETRAGPSAPAHRAVIWVVVDDKERVLVRSWLGARGRWYREARQHDSGTLRVRDRAVPVRFVVADDPGRVAACSRAIAAKYADSQSRWGMLRDEILETTIELLPLRG